MDTTLIIASNPNQDSLSVHAAQYAYAQLQHRNVPCAYYYLDECAYDPMLSQEEILRRASFDTQTIRFQQAVQRATQLALYYPDWWGMPPALLVGWIQRVFAPGVAFEHSGEDFMPKTYVPLLAHVKVMLAITSNEADQAAVMQSTRILIDRLFDPVGITNVCSHILHNTRECTYATRHAWMEAGVEILFQ